jgi:hypothetical protein
VLVIRAAARVDPFKALVGARERDVDLVVIGGRAEYGKPALMKAAGSAATTSLKVDGEARALVLRRPDDPAARWEWTDVLARLEEVRADPAGAIERARIKQGAALAATYLARSRNGTGGPMPTTPLRLGLDMPTGLTPLGGLPKQLDEITVPAPAGLGHDRGFLDSIVGHGYHGGLLDDLAGFYR